MTLDDLVRLVALVGPGFVALKLFYLFRAEPSRSQWEWTVWSVLAGVAIATLAGWIAPFVTSRLHSDPVVADALLRISLAVGLATVVGLLWLFAKKSRWSLADLFVRRLTDSAWDHVLEGYSEHRFVEVVLNDGTEYYGWVLTAGREDARAELFVHLGGPKTRSQGSTLWTDMPDYDSLMIHQRDIRVMRFWVTATERRNEAAADFAATGTGLHASIVNEMARLNRFERVAQILAFIAVVAGLACVAAHMLELGITLVFVGGVTTVLLVPAYGRDKRDHLITATAMLEDGNEQRARREYDLAVGRLPGKAVKGGTTPSLAVPAGSGLPEKPGIDKKQIATRVKGDEARLEVVAVQATPPRKTKDKAAHRSDGA